MMIGREHKKDDDELMMPFQGLNKTAVLQETRQFNSAQLNTRKCANLLTKLLWLLAQGETFSRIEATSTFFDITKLFQSNNATLRRMVYLTIKELAPMADQAFIAVNTLCKDMNLNNDIYQASAIRTLRKIISEPSMLSAIERHLKQSIVKDGAVASAALVSGLHIASIAPDMVKKWASEINEALSQSSPMVQYHALALLYKIRNQDRLAVSKLVLSAATGGRHLSSPLAHCLLVRYAARVIREDTYERADKGIINYLFSCLNHRSEMAAIEAARALTSLPDVPNKDLSPAISVLQHGLTSFKPTYRFAAIRTLNEMANTRPLLVSLCNVEMEGLISDPNRSISTLAITTLLKTGSENSIDRLLKQISTYMNDIQDEFKIIVIEAMRTLCHKYPHKYRALLSFLSDALRDEGGFEFKHEIVETVVSMVQQIPDSREDSLLQLCEFIEDCEFPALLQQILNLLGREVPTTRNPSKYIRFINNRVILECASVRASAVSALARIAAMVPKLRSSIIVLLNRCTQDNDDEVRDRAVYYDDMLRKDESTIKSFVLDDFPVPIPMFERALRSYVKQYEERPDVRFNIDKVPELAVEEAAQSSGAKPAKAIALASAALGDQRSVPSSTAASGPPASSYEALFMTIPRLAALIQKTPISQTSPQIELTESEIEYVVNCVMHILPHHIVFQFNVTNTVETHQLQNVWVETDFSTTNDLHQDFVVPAAKIGYNDTEPTFVVCRQDSEVFPPCVLSNVLKFHVVEVDSSTGEVEDEGTEDEYQLEDLELNISDFLSQ